MTLEREHREIAPQLALPEPATWTKPKGRAGCGRDPNAGPGSCWHWWEGCPDAKKRGCYMDWLRSTAPSLARSEP